jgi:hypothetical protein
MKKIILLLFMLLAPFSAFAVVPVLVLLATASSLSGPILFGMQVTAVVSMWPLAVALAGFYYFMKVSYTIAEKKAYESGASQLQQIWVSAYVVLAVSFVSLFYYFDGYAVLMEIYKEANA